ncbi:MAG: hypothetical protein HY961_22165 [Ignavibacteriae bacterium]|nr:hypothetical protein [Ignavibacteriota bacterium]
MISVLLVSALVFELLRLYAALVVSVCTKEAAIAIVCPLKVAHIALDDIAMIKIRHPRWWFRAMVIRFLRTSGSKRETFVLLSPYGDERVIFQRLATMFEAVGVKVQST